jgi:signal transduction histidine kinase
VALDAGLRALASSGTVGLCEWRLSDGTASIIDADDAFLSLIGHTRASFAAEPDLDWRRLTPPEGQARLAERLRTLSETGSHGPREQDVIRHDGDRVPVLVTSALIDGGNGSAISLCVSLAEQVRARVDADRAHQSQSRFLSVMTHELRTPLNTIVGQAELLADGTYGSVTEKQHEALMRLRRASQQLRALVDDVLTYSRIETGTVEYEVDSMCLDDSLSAVSAAIRSQAAAKRITLEVEEVPSTLCVYAHAEKVQQVLLALLSNAVKFTPSGGRVAIDIPLRDEVEDFVFVRVTDTGSGVARARQDAIFEPFMQMDEGRARTATGLGLGLTIARDLARGMGGDIRVRSAEGGGSTFTLSLRRAADLPLKSPDEPAEN